MPGYYGNEHLDRKIHAKKNDRDFTIILSIMRIKNSSGNVDWFSLKMADQSYLVKIILIMHNKYLKADIAHNFVIAPKQSNVFEQTYGWTQVSYRL